MTTPLQSDRTRVMVRLLDDDLTLALSRRRMAEAMHLTRGQLDYLLGLPEPGDIWAQARAEAMAARHATRRCSICGRTSAIGDFAKDASRPGGYSYRHLICNRLMVRAYRAGG